MGEVLNCPKCGGLFIKVSVRDICEKCYKEEEKLFDVVYEFLRKSKNRMATIPQITEETGVEERLLFKWIRAGRLRPSLFPNIGYPCDKCGTLIGTGKLCKSCMSYIRQELEQHASEERHQQQLKQGTYKFTQR